jgi:hypothetical protein
MWPSTPTAAWSWGEVGKRLGTNVELLLQGEDAD